MLRKRSISAILGVVTSLGMTRSADAFRIELKDVAPDRIERQRAEAIGQIPLPGTPNISRFDERLKDVSVAAGAAVFIRVFKAESELEVWLQKGDRFVLFATYPVCHWSGTLGPKINEGDKQTPEGVYTVAARQVHASARHPKALNLGFPNVLDRHFDRTGSYILIHGGCGSVGCFGMTNPVIDEIFKLARAALSDGQDVIHVHSFPFRLTAENLRAQANSPWHGFWSDLKLIFDAFNATKRVPRVTVCNDRYRLDALDDRKRDPSALPGVVTGQPHRPCSDVDRSDVAASGPGEDAAQKRDEHMIAKSRKVASDPRSSN